MTITEAIPMAERKRQTEPPRNHIHFRRDGKPIFSMRTDESFNKQCDDLIKYLVDRGFPKPSGRPNLLVFLVRQAYDAAFPARPPIEFLSMVDLLMENEPVLGMPKPESRAEMLRTIVNRAEQKSKRRQIF